MKFSKEWYSCVDSCWLLFFGLWLVQFFFWLETSHFGTVTRQQLVLIIGKLANMLLGGILNSKVFLTRKLKTCCDVWKVKFLLLSANSSHLGGWIFQSHCEALRKEVREYLSTGLRMARHQQPTWVANWLELWVEILSYRKKKAHWNGKNINKFPNISHVFRKWSAFFKSLNDPQVGITSTSCGRKMDVTP